MIQLDFCEPNMGGNPCPALTKPIMKGSIVAITHPIPIDVLRQLLRLDAETGKLYWLPRGPQWFTGGAGRYTAARNAAVWNANFAGREAFTASAETGRKTKKLRFSGAILSKNYLKHRVVFALHYGRWPVNRVDHRDRDPSNNRPENLREATQFENTLNMAAYAKPMTSQFKGVFHIGKDGPNPWRARFRSQHLGVYPTEIAAAVAYDRAAKECSAEFAFLNFPQEEG